MASLNPLTRELVFKIVFYGPGLGGKTTTLQYIHAASKPEHRGKMVSLATPMDRTLYFDFLPLRMPLLHGMHVRLQLFTVPGQVYYGATRKLVLTGADGVVFVADSQHGRQDANLESLEDLVTNLAEHNRALMNIPHAFHWNKRDLPDVVPVPELEKALNAQGAPSQETVATRGNGVFEGLERITRLVFAAYEAELPKAGAEAERQPVEEATIADALRGLTETNRRPRNTPPDSQATVAPPVSSLESIPNPIPRRPTGNYDVSPTGAVRQVLPSPHPPPSAPAASPRSAGFAPASGGPAGLAPASTSGPSSTSAGAASVAEPTLTSARTITPAPPRPPAPQSQTRGASPMEDGLAGLASVVPPSGGPSSSPQTRTSGSVHSFSFAGLWSEADRDGARQCEAAIATGDGLGAVLVCDVLVNRLLASAGTMGGTAEAIKDPAVLATLLGLDGKRYLAFRAAVRSARLREGVSVREALDVYSFALEVRRAHASLGQNGGGGGD